MKELIRSFLPKYIQNLLGFLYYRKQLFDNGTWPRFRAEKTLRRLANNPDTFSKKIRYKMAYDRKDVLTVFADKVSVRKYVADRIGMDYLTTLYGVVDLESLTSLPLKNLPRNYVIKANHGSGGVIIVNESASMSATLPNQNVTEFCWGRFQIHPDNLDWQQISLILKEWLSRNYDYKPGHFPQWAYSNIQPKILFEELLVTPLGAPSDFRFFTFNGKCEFISTGPPFYQEGGITRDFYDLNWTKIPVKGLYPNSKEMQPSPNSLSEMIKVAESLAAGTDQVRIDLYDLAGRIAFGEMTIYHNAGAETFFPEHYNFEFGKSWSPKYLTDSRNWISRRF